MRIGSRGGPCFGMFLLTFTPPLNVTHSHNLPVNVCSNEIITFAASSFDPVVSADLSMRIYITCPCSQSHYFPSRAATNASKALNPTPLSILPSLSSLLNLVSLWPRRNQKSHIGLDAAKNITNTERTCSGQIVLDEVETPANITLLSRRCHTIIVNGRVH